MIHDGTPGWKCRGFGRFGLGILLVIGAVAPIPGWAQNPPKKQKPATELIIRQDPPMVSPRVLELGTEDNVHIYVSLQKQRAYLKVGDEVAIDTPISSGKRTGMTPMGEFAVLEKKPEFTSSVYGEFVGRKSGKVVRSGVSTKIDSAPSGTVFRGVSMRWFLLLHKGGFGMHAGDLPGFPASHGTVRLPEKIAKMIFERVKVGTPVVIGD